MLEKFGSFSALGFTLYTDTYLCAELCKGINLHQRYVEIYCTICEPCQLRVDIAKLFPHK